MVAISKSVFFDVLDDIVNKYNNKVHRTIKMKPIDVTSDSYVEYNEDSNEKDPIFKAGDCVAKKELQKTNQKGFRIEKIIKWKGNKLYVKWKGYDSSFNSWIDKKDLVWF